MAVEEPFAVRSYRLCFELERRIHKIDRWRIPVPYGVPLRGIAYAALALVVILVASGVPAVGQMLGLVHPAIRLVVAPVGVAYALCRLRIDGRPAHSAGLAWGRMLLAPRRIAGFRPAAAGGNERLGDLVLAPDERACRLRRAVVRGPAVVLLRYPASASRRGRTLHLRQRGGGAMWRGKRVCARAGQRLMLR
jgi:hypothetical protein